MRISIWAVVRAPPFRFTFERFNFKLIIKAIRQKMYVLYEWVHQKSDETRRLPPQHTNHTPQYTVRRYARVYFSVWCGWKRDGATLMYLPDVLPEYCTVV